jgi:transcriptional regulator
MADLFTRYSTSDVATLIASYPLAIICSFHNNFIASQMPMLLEQEDGVAKSLLGHFPKQNPHFEVLTNDPNALFIFHGPQSYVSPTDAGKSDWAPTWNFATVQIEAKVCFDDMLTDQSLEAIVEAMERERGTKWSTGDLGARYDSLRARVMGFRAHITNIRARFKLGQDESEAVFESIVANTGDTALTSWMRRMRGV